MNLTKEKRGINRWARSIWKKNEKTPVCIEMRGRRIDSKKQEKDLAPLNKTNQRKREIP